MYPLILKFSNDWILLHGSYTFICKIRKNIQNFQGLEGVISLFTLPLKLPVALSHSLQEVHNKYYPFLIPRIWRQNMVFESSCFALLLLCRIELLFALFHANITMKLPFLKHQNYGILSGISSSSSSYGGSSPFSILIKNE